MQIYCSALLVRSSSFLKLERILIDSKEKAQNAPMAWTNYALFFNGEYITNEILSEKKFSEITERNK
ncbi:MAG: YoaP domain-containing protein [Clostridia bacterium]|nr:YoaP domain-containing protein [Clostridia bacterium]